MKESEIRPKELFDEYLRLSAEDVKLIKMDELVAVDCPACESKKHKEHLSKNGFQFVKCDSCNTLFCSPRPSTKDLLNFYSNSESSRYWSEVFFPTVEKARREKMFKPKATKIKDYFQGRGVDNFTSICDFGAGHGILLEELGRLYPDAKLNAVEPSPEMSSICEKKGISVIQSFAEDFSGESLFDLVLSFEVIEHVFNPFGYVSSMANSLKKGGFLLLTGLGYEGFDILTLQDKSKSISPPHHINFLSLKGFESIAERAGLGSIEVITPGELDIDIVLNTGFSSEFIDVLRGRGEKVLNEFQHFLRDSKMSSHVWLIAKKV